MKKPSAPVAPKVINSAITTATVKHFVHEHSIVIEREREAAQFLMHQSECAIVQLSAAISNERMKIKELQSKLEGLTLVMSQR